MARKKTPKNTRPLPIINFTVTKVDDYNTLAKDDTVKDVLFTFTVDAIKHAISEDLQDVDLFKLDNEQVTYNLSKDKFKSVLKRAQEFYSGKDQFEKCIDIQSIMQVL